MRLRSGLNADCEAEMQRGMDSFSDACNNFGLTIISTKKTDVMHQPAPNTHFKEPSVHANGVKLQAVDKFTYLGSSTLSISVSVDSDD